MKRYQKQGFTLVELIVVIAILAILGTIAFLNLQGYNNNARDSVRINDLGNIDKGLGLMIVTNGKVPIPDDNKINITASGVLLGVQGYAGTNVLNQLGISINGGKDPKDEQFYTYSTNANNTKYQLLGFIESTLSKSEFIGKSYATDYTNRIIITKGDELGIILSNTGSNTNKPAQEYTSGSIDLSKVTTSSGYIVQFTNIETSSTSLSSGYTGSLFSVVYNKRSDLLYNKSIANLDNDLVGYWDMESLTGTLLKDLSNYGNNCTGNGGIVFGNSNGKIGKSTAFDGLSNTCSAGTKSALSFTGNFTISAWIYPTSYHTVGYFGLKNMILSRGPATTYNYALQVTNNTTISFIKRTGAEGLQYYNFTGISSLRDKWTHITIKVLNNTARLYLDGTLYGTKTVGTIAPGASDSLYIGGNSNTETKYQGYLDDIRIYKRALSDTEILTRYNTKQF